MTHPALLVAVQLHPAVATTVKLEVAPLPEMVALAGEIEKLHEPPLWVRVKVWLAMVRVPVRGLRVGLAGAA